MAVAGRRVVVWFHSGCGCGVPIADERFFEFAAGGMRHFERLDARWPSAVRGGGEQHALMCDVAYHPQPNGKTFFIRGEACGGHTCLHELRASARGGFGPPIPAGSNRSGYVRFMVRIAFIRTAACEGTRRLRSGPSPGRSCGPPMSVTSSHAACSTASRRMIHDLSDRSLRRDATVTKRAFAGRSCGPPMACAIAFGHAIAGSAHSRADGRAIKESSPPSPKGGCGLPHICASSLTGQKQSDAAVRRIGRRTAHAVQTASRVRMG